MKKNRTQSNTSKLTLSALRKVFSLLPRRQKGLSIILLAAIVISLYWNWRIFYTHHTVPVPAKGGTLVEGVLGQPHYINPILATTPTDQTIVHAVFSGLYRYDTNGDITPELATSMPEVGSDGKHYTVRIRPGVTWHDGKAITADDVLFTISEIQNESVQSPLRSLWLSTTVQKLDALTIVFTTKDISAPFVHNLTLPLLPEHIWRGVNPENLAASPLNLKPLGSGPFALRQIEKDPSGTVQRIQLERFDSHIRKPQLDGITIVFYESAEDLRQGYASREVTSIGLSISDTITTETSTPVKQIALPQYQALFLNTTSTALSDPQVRKALRVATDSRTISDGAWGERARPITQVPLGLVKHESTVSPASKEEAQKILEAAGWKKNSAGLRTKGAASLSLTLATTDTPSFKAAAELVAQSWQAIGVQVNIQALPANDLITEYVRPRRYDVLLFSQRTGADSDPFAFWHSSQTKDPGLNVSNFSSGDADKLITDARTATTTEERTKLYEQLATLLQSQTPAIYLNQSLYTYALNKNITSNSIVAMPDASWRLSYAPDWYIATGRKWGKE